MLSIAYLLLWSHSLMKKLFLILTLCFSQSYGAPHIKLTLSDNLFVRIAVPKKGVVSSNQGRVERMSKILANLQVFEVPWGPKIFIGEFKGERFFIASAPVGSGSGLMFTELYSAGAEYIIRYGSDDVKETADYEQSLVKIIDETDNLYGYNMASGVAQEEWGKSVFASEKILSALEQESTARQLPIEKRVCHHLENYHALRTPEKFSAEREQILRQQLAHIKRTDKKESFDMESAVLFKVAKDFGKHAATVLQTVNKKSSKEGPYEGKNKEQAVLLETTFIDFILSSLLRIN